MAAIAAERYTGASVKRSEDPRILTGAGRYVDDIKLPGCCTPHSCARRWRTPACSRWSLGRAGAARGRRGVHRRRAGSHDGPGPDALMALMGGDGPTPEFTLLATDKVRFVGDPVVIVIAESRYLAEDGCELVEVEYDDLPPVTNAAFALDPSSPPLFANLGDNIVRPHSRNEFGDVEGTFAGADRVFDFHIGVHRHQNVPMEGRGCVASYDPDRGFMTVHAATQGVHVTQDGRRHAPRHGAGQGARRGRRHRRLVRPEDRRHPGRSSRPRPPRARSAGRSSGSRTAARTSPRPGRPARRASTSGPPSATTATCSAWTSRWSSTPAPTRAWA